MDLIVEKESEKQQQQQTTTSQQCWPEPEQILFFIRATDQDTKLITVMLIVSLWNFPYSQKNSQILDWGLKYWNFTSVEFVNPLKFYYQAAAWQVTWKWAVRLKEF